MFYRLLGLAVWKGAKLLLRQKYGSLYAPKALVAGGALAAVAGAVALVLRRDGSDD